MTAVLNAEVAPSKRLIAIAGSLFSAAMLMFLFIAEDVADGGGLISHDQAVMRWFVDHRSDWMISAARFVSTAGGFASLLVIGVVLGIVLRRRAWHLAIALSPVIALLLASGAATAAKAIFGRPRPPIAFHEVHVSSPAFPSGHATDAAAFFLAAAFVVAITVVHRRRTQLVLVGVGVFLAALVGVSRLILAVHWLSDVVAGWALGTAIAIATVVVAWFATTRRDEFGTRAESDPKAHN
jgi:undecaprenyl-diphosphatase